MGVSGQLDIRIRWTRLSLSQKEFKQQKNNYKLNYVQTSTWAHSDFDDNLNDAQNPTSACNADVCPHKMRLECGADKLPVTVQEAVLPLQKYLSSTQLEKEGD